MALSLLAGLATPVVALAAEGSTAATTTAVPSLPLVAARPADSLVETFGINTHFAYSTTAYAKFDSLAARLDELGVRHVRERLIASSTVQHDRLRQLASQGIKSNIIAGDPTFEGGTPEQLVKILGDKMPDAVESVEGANEWNLSGDPSWVANLRSHQRRVYTAVKADTRLRGVSVLAPALGRREGYELLGDLTAYADKGNAHLYPGGRSPSIRIDEVSLKNKIVTGNKPLIYSEAGFHDAMNSTSGHRATSQAVAGVYAPRLLLEHYLRGTQRVYQYELVDERPESALTDPEQHFGLLKNDLTPKPAFRSLTRLLGLAEDPGPAFTPQPLAMALEGAPLDLRKVLLQRRDGTHVLAVWRDVESWDPVAEKDVPVTPAAVKLRLGQASDVVVHRPSATTSPVSATGVVEQTLSLGADVAIIEIHAALDAPTVEAQDVNATTASVAPVTGTAPAGSTVTVTVSDGTRTTTAGATAGSTGRWSLRTDLTSLADGPLTVHAVARTTTLRTSDAGAGSLHKDTQAPVLVSSAPARDALVVGTGPVSVTLDGPLAPGGTLTLTGPSGAVAGTVTTDGAVLTHTPSARLADGAYVAQVSGADRAGNALRAQVPFTVDGTAPVAPAVAQIADVDHGTMADVPVVGSTEPGARVAVKVQDTERELRAATRAGADGRFSLTLDLSAFADGALSLGATATDAAGNTSAATSRRIDKSTRAGAPAELQAVRKPNSLQLAWTAPIVTGGAPVLDYRVVVTRPDGVSTTTTVAGEQALVEGLAEGTRYGVTVQARTAAGHGQAVEAAFATQSRVVLRAAPNRTTVLRGQSLTISGKATGTDGAVLGGLGLTLMAQDATGATTRLTDVATDDLGGWRSSFAPERSARYYVVYAGSADLAWGKSNTTTQVTLQ